MDLDQIFEHFQGILFKTDLNSTCAQLFWNPIYIVQHSCNGQIEVFTEKANVFVCVHSECTYTTMLQKRSVCSLVIASWMLTQHSVNDRGGVLSILTPWNFKPAFFMQHKFLHKPFSPVSEHIRQTFWQNI